MIYRTRLCISFSESSVMFFALGTICFDISASLSRTSEISYDYFVVTHVRIKMLRNDLEFIIK